MTTEWSGKMEGSAESGGTNFLSDPFGTVNSWIDAYTGKSNVDAQRQINQQQLAFSQHIYDQSRADALADWERQNKYNLPSEIMKRLKDAGLNPNLIYGSANNNVASNIRSGQFNQPNLQAPQWKNGGPIGAASDMLMTFMSARRSKADIDLIDANTSIAEQKALGERLDNERKAFLMPQSKWTGKKFTELEEQLLNRELEINRGISNKATLDAYRGSNELQKFDNLAQDLINKEQDEGIKRVMKNNLQNQGKIIESELKIYEDFLPKGSSEYMRMATYLLINGIKR